MNCRNCGAPVPVKSFTVCEYCRTEYGKRPTFTPAPSVYSPMLAQLQAAQMNGSPLSSLPLLGAVAGAMFLIPFARR